MQWPPIAVRSDAGIVAWRLSWAFSRCSRVLDWEELNGGTRRPVPTAAGFGAGSSTLGPIYWTFVLRMRTAMPPVCQGTRALLSGLALGSRAASELGRSADRRCRRLHRHRSAESLSAALYGGLSVADELEPPMDRSLLHSPARVQLMLTPRRTEI